MITSRLASSISSFLRTVASAIVWVAAVCLCSVLSQILDCFNSSLAIFEPDGRELKSPLPAPGKPGSMMQQSDSLESVGGSFLFTDGISCLSCTHPSDQRGTSFTINHTCWNVNSEFLASFNQYSSSAFFKTSAALLPLQFALTHCWCTPMNLATSCLIWPHLVSKDLVDQTPIGLFSS